MCRSSQQPIVAHNNLTLFSPPHYVIMLLPFAGFDCCNAIHCRLGRVFISRCQAILEPPFSTLLPPLTRASLPSMVVSRLVSPLSVFPLTSTLLVSLAAHKSRRYNPTTCRGSRTTVVLHCCQPRCESPSNTPSRHLFHLHGTNLMFLFKFQNHNCF